MILTFNVGSSSIKVALYQKDESLLCEIEEDTNSSLEEVVDKILKKLPSQASIIGHRIVHGGSFYAEPTLITEKVLQNLEKLIPYSPLHLPLELRVVKKLQSLNLRQIACFDTAFHRAMPALHQRFPLPTSLWDEGIKRYGFHGLSYEYLLSVLDQEIIQGKLILAHLGNGASLCGVLNGKPIDTTMGFTPTGGVMMGTRSGDLDPGVLSYLMREKNYSGEQIEELINKKAGLLAVSETSSDMKTLLEKRSTDKKADAAIQLFCYHIQQAIGSLAASLNGVDYLVLTGGIGEHSPEIKNEILKNLSFLNIKEVLMVPTNENRMIARHCKKFL